MRRGKITTESATPAGGNIDVAIGDIADLRDSEITTSVTKGTEPGGDIRLVPKSTAVVLQNSRIVAEADHGAGGSILISTNALISDVDSLVSADSNFGVDGTVVTDSPEDINVEQSELSVPPIDVSSLLREACALRDPGPRARSSSSRIPVRGDTRATSCRRSSRTRCLPTTTQLSTEERALPRRSASAERNRGPNAPALLALALLPGRALAQAPIRIPRDRPSERPYETPQPEEKKIGAEGAGRPAASGTDPRLARRERGLGRRARPLRQRGDSRRDLARRRAPLPRQAPVSGAAAAARRRAD